MSGADERFEQALGGSPPPAEDELGAFVRDVREAFPAQPMLAEEAHLAAIADAARRISPEVRPAQRKELGVTWRDVLLRKIRSRAAMVVAGLVVVTSSFGGLAFAGGLPGGVQDHVANVAATLGVDLPGGDDETEAVEVDEDATETEAPEPAETEAPESDDQGEDEQSGDQGEDEQSGDQGEDEQSGDQGEDEQSGDQGEDEQGDADESSNDGAGGGDHESSDDQGGDQESSSNDGGAGDNESGDSGGDESGDGGSGED